MCKFNHCIRTFTEVDLTINKLTAFVGESGLQIRCQPNGKTIVNPVWMIIEFEGFQSRRPMVYLFGKDGKDVLEWGEEFNVTHLQSHITATGHLEGIQSFLQLDFSHVVCGDGGRYTCSYGGFDKMGKLRKFSTSGDFVTKSLYYVIIHNKTECTHNWNMIISTVRCWTISCLSYKCKISVFLIWYWQLFKVIKLPYLTMQTAVASMVITLLNHTCQ